MNEQFVKKIFNSTVRFKGNEEMSLIAWNDYLTLILQIDLEKNSPYTINGVINGSSLKEQRPALLKEWSKLDFEEFEKILREVGGVNYYLEQIYKIESLKNSFPDIHLSIAHHFPVIFLLKKASISSKFFKSYSQKFRHMIEILDKADLLSPKVFHRIAEFKYGDNDNADQMAAWLWAAETIKKFCGTIPLNQIIIKVDDVIKESLEILNKEDWRNYLKEPFKKKFTPIKTLLNFFDTSTQNKEKEHIKLLRLLMEALFNSPHRYKYLNILIQVYLFDRQVDNTQNKVVKINVTATEALEKLIKLMELACIEHYARILEETVINVQENYNIPITEEQANKLFEECEKILKTAEKSEGNCTELFFYNQDHSIEQYGTDTSRSLEYGPLFFKNEKVCPSSKKDVDVFFRYNKSDIFNA